MEEQGCGMILVTGSEKAAEENVTLETGSKLGKLMESMKSCLQVIEKLLWKWTKECLVSN